MAETMQPLRPYDPMDTLKQFLDHDRHVLRFYCYWDDRDEMFGDVRYMILHYYLADDTIEVFDITLKGAITSKIKHAIKLKTSPTKLAQLLIIIIIIPRTIFMVLLRPSLACFF